ncbi:DNA-binding protein YbaB [Actinokineospora baliensis]|uniref:YbaB/EbfC family nucleoid-associated protein n=1 Tax=Actinokineospora baliensis TaxID=547056 RepID=UPI00195CB55D|nr:YbaB/EbfC family nucleoid-associated protein [Actinokineospora baliensis]MBM7773877.1 DNA-binding protein YbaB [Actinokineospora baliensis]
MDERVLDPDAARERMAAWKGRIDKLAADTQAMGARLREVQATAADPGGLAEVTVDSTGSLVGLRLTDRIHKTPPDAVAQAILATLRAARGQVAEQSREVIAETMGPDSAAGRAIAERVDQHLRAPQAPDEYGDGDFDLQTHVKKR